MKKLLRLVVIALVLVLVLASLPARAESPYTTWAWGPGQHFYMTQDAYTPSAEVDLPIAAAEDMFVAPDGFIYVADTDNGQIVKLKDFQVSATFGKGILQGPTGIFVDQQGVMYVADAKSNSIVI